MEKLSKQNDPNLKISVFIGQKAIYANNIMNLLQIYHSGVFFVEESKHKNFIKNKANAKDILFAIELWGTEGNPDFGIASCMFPEPSMMNNEVDPALQSINEIIIKYPEGFGCSPDGGYFNRYYDKTWYMGDTTLSNIKNLYNFSNNWLSTKWGYVGSSILSEPCSSVDNLPSSFVLGNTCDSFAQGICLELKKNDPSFKGMLSDAAWNDIQVFGNFQKVNLRNPKEYGDLKEYLRYLKAQITKVESIFIKENFDSDSETDFDFDFDFAKNNNLISKFVINTVIGKKLFPLIVKIAINSPKQSNNGQPFIYLSSFEDNKFVAYKVTLSTPYLQSIYSVCPGILYEKLNPADKVPTANYM
jgi:hypothetical protein